MKQGLKAALPCAMLLISITAATTACSPDGKKNDDAAAKAAKAFYDSLNNGGYEYFTDMHYRKERIPQSYHSQLVDNTKMFLSELRQTHGELTEVRVANCKNDTTGNKAEAFLILCFSDSTKEETVVPMVKVNDKWMMR